MLWGKTRGRTLRARPLGPTVYHGPLVADQTPRSGLGSAVGSFFPSASPVLIPQRVGPWHSVGLTLTAGHRALHCISQGASAAPPIATSFSCWLRFSVSWVLAIAAYSEGPTALTATTDAS